MFARTPRLLLRPGFPEDALALVRAQQPRAVVLDINLSDESGIEVRHRLKAAGILLPVIYITGKDNHATRMAAMESGCIAYLTKPFAAKSLMEPIERESAGFV